MRKYTKLSLVLMIMSIFIFAFSGTVFAANLVQNGSFEFPEISGDYGGWSQFSSISNWSLSNGTAIEIQEGVCGPAKDGDQFLELDSNYSSAISQNITTTAGSWYTLSFWFSPRPGTGTADNHLEVHWDGTIVADLTASGIGKSTTDWTFHSYKIKATSATTQITFADKGVSNSTGTFVDNIIVEEYIQPIQIDVKPGSNPNSFNVNGTGTIPIVILGSAELDVTQIDISTINFAGMAVKVVGKSDKALAHYEDITGPASYPDGTNLQPDGYLDLVVQIADTDGTFSEGQTTATLTGLLSDGTKIVGSDYINIVPN